MKEFDNLILYQDKCKGTVLLTGQGLKGIVIFSGNWNNGYINGDGIITFQAYTKEAQRYEGELNKGDKHGFGRFFLNTGKVQVGQWNKGQFIKGKTYSRGEYEYYYDYKKDEVLSKTQNINIDTNIIRLIGTGTGFFINDSGYIVSNNHVAGVCKKVEAIYNNQTLTADLIANDKVNDLAIAKINTSKKTKHLNISSGSKFGEDIKVYGFPLTNRLGSGLKVTKGIVSSLNGPGNNYSLIQIDAPIQPGNSGGPILNKNGNLVGIAVASISTPLMMSDTTIIPQNINFGVKSETLSNFLKANSIKYNSNDKPIAESDNLALQSTVQLNCYNTLREARKFKEQGLVRNILED